MRDLAMLYLGAFAPDTTENTNPATSRAGLLFQTSFLRALTDAKIGEIEVRSYYPVASFPRVRRLLCLPRTDRLDPGIRVRSLGHLNLGFLKILTLGLSSAWAVLAWAVRNRGRRRVVVSYNLNAPPAFIVGPVCRALGVKFVPFVGDIYVPGEVVGDTLLRRLEFAAQCRAVSRADGLLACNRAIVDDFAPGRDHLLVEGGFEDRFCESRTRREDGVFRVVFAGQLTELNGVRLLMQAMELVEDPGVRLTVMGGGPLEELVRTRASSDKRIEYLGLVPHDEVVAQYAQADLLLNLRSTGCRTHRYVFPSKVVECLATGVPLLSTRTGHIESEFGEFVFLLDSESPEALAGKLREVMAMAEEDRLSVGRSARQYALANKTWGAQVRKLTSYLEESVFAQGEAA